MFLLPLGIPAWVILRMPDSPDRLALFIELAIVWLPSNVHFVLVRLNRN